MTTPRGRKRSLLGGPGGLLPRRWRLNKEFFNALQLINVPGGAVDLSNILFSNNYHKAKHRNMTLKRMEAPLQAYDNSVAADANNAVHAKAERLCTAKIELQRLINTVKRAERAFLVAVVNETWFLPLN